MDVIRNGDGEPLAVVIGGHVHEIVDIPREYPEEGPAWASRLADLELIDAEANLRRSIVSAWSDTGADAADLLAQADEELSLVEEELMRRGFSARTF